MRRRDDLRSLMISLAVHVVVLGALGRMVLGPVRWADLFDLQKEPIVHERLQFVQLPPRGDPGRENRQGRAGGDGRPERADAPPAPALVAPVEVPSMLPPAPSEPAKAAEVGGTGPLVGGGGPTKGLRPTFSDPRLWARPDEGARGFGGTLATRPSSDQLDSLLFRSVQRFRDSVLAANNGQAPKGWVYERDGQKWGVDDRYIRLGRWSSPTAVLAFLPLNVQANPGISERGRALASMQYEINWQASREANVDEFKAAVKAVRQRKERERQERLRQQGGGTATPVSEPSGGRPVPPSSGTPD